jgi:hypothetical protein
MNPMRFLADDGAPDRSRSVSRRPAHGRILGLLSTSIGMLPLGMIALGELTEAVGARAAVLSFTLAGAGLLLLWLWLRPEVLDITA